MRLMGFVAMTLAAIAATEGRSAGRPEAVKNEYFDNNIPDSETSLTAEDFNNANKLPIESFLSTEKRETVDTKAMENPNMFEGDIAGWIGFDDTTIYRSLGEFQANSNDDSNGMMRNAIKRTSARWPGATIPYTISARYTSAARRIIADAMSEFVLRSCIKFIPRTTQTDYIHIMPDSGCYSYVGKLGDRQTLSLSAGCIDRGIIMHELMHAVGFLHEQSRPDRDQYVEILYQNIRTGFARQFEKATPDHVDNLNQPYDYYSVMHYGPRAFSRNGQETIRPVASARASGVTLGRRQQFSNIDVSKLNIIAQCADAGVVTTPSVVGTTSCQDTSSSCALLSSNQQFCTINSIRQLCLRTCNLC